MTLFASTQYHYTLAVFVWFYSVLVIGPDDLCLLSLMNSANS